MKKLLALSIICLSTITNAQNLVKINDPKMTFPAVAYKTTKPLQVQYSISYYNYQDPDPNYERDFDKNGLYRHALLKLGKNLPEDYPETYPTIDESKLIKLLKFNENEIISKFKAVGKKQKYFCTVDGQMLAQFRIDYEGGDAFRFGEEQVYGDIYSATPVGKPTIICEKFKY